MTPASLLEQEEARHKATKNHLRRVQAELTELSGAKGVARHKPRGKLDSKGAGTAAAGGAVCAPVGMYSNEIVDLINKAAHRTYEIPNAIWDLSMVQDLLGGLVGFFVGALTIGTWKAAQQYGAPK